MYKELFISFFSSFLNIYYIHLEQIGYLIVEWWWTTKTTTTSSDDDCDDYTMV